MSEWMNEKVNEWVLGPEGMGGWLRWSPALFSGPQTPSPPQCSVASHAGQPVHSGESSAKPGVDVPWSYGGSQSLWWFEHQVTKSMGLNSWQSPRGCSSRCFLPSESWIQGHRAEREIPELTGLPSLLAWICPFQVHKTLQSIDSVRGSCYIHSTRHREPASDPWQWDPTGVWSYCYTR